ncbi:PAP2 domain-containing protein [Venturia nashicola]|nr:PAP2 domain-containing protein [Venturia nashicola]
MVALVRLMPAKRLLLSYVVDWVVIIGIAAIGAAFNAPGPYKRPFSLVDLSISYPYVPSQISTALLVVLSLVVPAGIIFAVCLLFVPGPTVSPNTPKSLIWRRKLWEWNTGWMGLALSLALAFLFTQGMKNIFGKPRPDMLARCQPDAENFREYLVGVQYAAAFDPHWVLVNADICKNSDTALVDDAFRSFPSGHASMSWSGLLYLAFFLCSKFAISLPFLHSRTFSRDAPPSLSKDSPTNSNSTTDSILPIHKDEQSFERLGHHGVPIRNQAAAPPVYLLALPLVPICAALYITATRFFQFHHHGFDILFGSFIGMASSWFSFRWYHLPIRQGSGWSWGARSRDRAWIVPVGVESYVGPEGWSSKKSDEKQVVNGNHNHVLDSRFDGQGGSADTGKDDAIDIEDSHNRV